MLMTISSNLLLFVVCVQGWCSFILLDLQSSADYFSLLLIDETAGGNFLSRFHH
jgi:hypothetical protein